MTWKPHNTWPRRRWQRPKPMKRHASLDEPSICWEALWQIKVISIRPMNISNGHCKYSMNVNYAWITHGQCIPMDQSFFRVQFPSEKINPARYSSKISLRETNNTKKEYTICRRLATFL